MSDYPSESAGRRLSVRLTTKAKGCLDSNCQAKRISPSELVNSMLESLAEEEPEGTEEPSTVDLHSAGIHVSEWTPRNCPECAVANADFEDEVECKDCGIALGSEEYARTKLKACPNCPLTFDKDGLPEHRHFVRVRK